MTVDLLVYALLGLALYLAWFLTREVVRAVDRLEDRDAQEALARRRG